MKILVVDDDKATLALCKAIFRGHATHLISDSREAVNAFQEIKPDLVVLDCRMPYIDGFQISKQLQLLDINCKIIMISASIAEDKKYEEYCDAFFLKPLDILRLRETANNLMLVSH